MRLQYLKGFPGSSDSKESTCNVEELGSIAGLGRSPGEGKGYPLQYSGLEISVDCIYSPWSCKELDTTEGLGFSIVLSAEEKNAAEEENRECWET